MMIQTQPSCFICKNPSNLWKEDSLTGRMVCPPCYEDTLYQDSLFKADWIAPRMCFTCQTRSTSQWIRLPSDKTKDQCQKCYDVTRSALAKSGQAGKACFTCQTDSTSQWIKLPSDKTKDQCKKCYDIAKSTLAASEQVDKTCSSCQTDSTPVWHKLSSDKAKNQCHTCYREDKKALRNEGQEKPSNSLKRKIEDISEKIQNQTASPAKGSC